MGTRVFKFPERKRKLVRHAKALKLGANPVLPGKKFAGLQATQQRFLVMHSPSPLAGTDTVEAFKKKFEQNFPDLEISLASFRLMMESANRERRKQAQKGTSLLVSRAK